MPPPTHIVTIPYPGLAAPHLVEQAGGQLGAGSAERVSEGDGAAVHVEAVRVDGQFLQAGEDLHGEGFVQFNEVDLVQRQAGELEGFLIAGTGPTPKRSGSTPAVANVTNRPSGVRPRSRA